MEDLEDGAVREEDLRGALDNSASNDNEDNAEDDEKEPINMRDYQLSRAIDLIQGVQIFKTLNQ